MTREELNIILEKHKKWYYNEKGGEKANLYGANLRGADLYGANLYGADLRGADLRGADLYGAKEIPEHVCPINCPETGSFIGYKKAYASEPVIVKLEITEDAKRSSATTRKCRCSKAKVLEITSLDGSKTCEEARSGHDKSFIYKVGETVEVEDFDEDRWNECSTGIHFFITRAEAVNY